MTAGMALAGFLAALFVVACAVAARALRSRHPSLSRQQSEAVSAPPLHRESSLPSTVEIDRQLLELLEERSPRIDCDLSEALYERAGRPGASLAFHVRCVGPRLDALEKSGSALVVGFPGRLYFGRRHEAAARAAGWTPAIADVKAGS
jgi:hypothetical protein